MTSLVSPIIPYSETLDSSSEVSLSGIQVDICGAYRSRIEELMGNPRDYREEPSSDLEFGLLWQEALEISGSSVLHWQPGILQGIVLYMPSMFGYNKRERITMSQEEWLNLVHPQDRRKHFHEVKKFLQNPSQEIFRSEYRVQGKDGKYLWVSTHGKVQERNKDGIPTLVIGRHTDISDRKIKEDTITYQESHDGLTHLLNRNAFLASVDSKLRGLSKEKDEGKAAILIINIIDFKDINDKYGYQSGDQILQQVAKKLQNTMRPDDIIARLGGDEFAVFLPHTSYESIRKIASRIQVFFDEKFTINIDSHYDLFLGDIKTEIAVSVFPDGAKNAHELLHNADIAMQHGPATIGENLYFYHEKMSDLLHEKQNMTIALTRALSLVGQLYPAYQAIVDKDGKAESFESLIRWNHPDKGNISPTEFIPIAEESGLIIDIGAKMLRDVCLQIRAWIDLGYDPPRVAVNVSVLQLTEGDFSATLQNILEETNIPANKITLEVTESMLMRNVGETIILLQKIKNLGIEISLDDFGTGYSSLSILAELPIDKMKVDRSFISDLSHRDKKKGDNAFIVCQSVISLAHLLGKKVVAEGIETEEQFHILRGMSCDFFQGYYFSRPVPAKDVRTEWLSRR